MFGNRGEGGGPDDDRFSLDKMNLDRNDHGMGGDIYDPFVKSNVSHDAFIILVENGFGALSLDEFYE